MPGGFLTRGQGFGHIAVCVADLERCKAMDIPLYMALGKHPNDKMISFYANTPSHFAVEFGCGGVEIHDDDHWPVRTYDALSEWGHKY